MDQRDLHEPTRKSRLGIKRFRAVSGKEPTHKCDNCGCKRYSPCNCKRR